MSIFIYCYLILFPISLMTVVTMSDKKAKSLSVFLVSLIFNLPFAGALWAIIELCRELF